jgi:hypothetical protein
MSFERLTVEDHFDGSPAAYKNRCYTFLIILCNEKDLGAAFKYASPVSHLRVQNLIISNYCSTRYLANDAILLHDDHPPVIGARNFIEAWGGNLNRMPNYHKDVRAIITESDDAPRNIGGMKVWVYSRIDGLGENHENARDSIDMMQFTRSGQFLSSKDVQRIVNLGDKS